VFRSLRDSQKQAILDHTHSHPSSMEEWLQRRVARDDDGVDDNDEGARKRVDEKKEKKSRPRLIIHS
jgi:hypothetical protein